jgi:tetratricopeptide (TPR) repeat protein
LTLEKLNKYPEAVEKYKRAIELNPNYSLAYYGWGYSLLSAQAKKEESDEKFMKFLELSNGKYPDLEISAREYLKSKAPDVAERPPVQ